MYIIKSYWGDVVQNCYFNNLNFRRVEVNNLTLQNRPQPS